MDVHRSLHQTGPFYADSCTLSGTALVGVQNANLIFQTTLAGHQSVYKSELLALVIAAENASHWSEVYCFIDNQSVVQGSRSAPLTARARYKRSARALWNRFFAAMTTRFPGHPLEVSYANHLRTM